MAKIDNPLKYLMPYEMQWNNPYLSKRTIKECHYQSIYEHQQHKIIENNEAFIRLVYK